jgi:hypothetical protein
MSAYRQQTPERQLSCQGFIAQLTANGMVAQPPLFQKHGVVLFQTVWPWILGIGLIGFGLSS